VCCLTSVRADGEFDDYIIIFRSRPEPEPRSRAVEPEGSNPAGRVSEDERERFIGGYIEGGGN
jgi:hypothetical protein